MKKTLMTLMTVMSSSAMMFAGENACVSECFLKCPKKPPKPCKKPCEKKLVTKVLTVRQPPPCECVHRWCDCGTDFFFTADFIYWTAREDSLDFAYSSGSSTVVGGDATPSEGKSYEVGRAWNPGFKVGAGLELCEWGWDVYAQYTWYHVENEKRHIGVNSGQTLYDGFWFINNPNNASLDNSYRSANAKWQYFLNVVDMELGRAFFIGNHFMLRPHVGLKWASNEDRFDVGFNSGTDGLSMKNHVESWGVGIRAGLQGNWHFTRCFSVFGETDLTGMWESFEAKRIDNDFDISRNTNTSDVFIREKHAVLLPVFEWKLGLRWETWWVCDNYHFAADVAWEQQIWFDQNNFVRLAGASPSRGRNLMLQGVTAGIRFDF